MKINIFTDKNLHHHLANGWSAEKLIGSNIKTLTGRTIVLENVSPQDLIAQLKLKIEDLEGIPAEKQELRKLRRKLNDDESVEESFILDGETLLMLIDGEASNWNVSTPEQEEEPTVMSTKVHEPTVNTKVITIDKQDDKEDKRNWWEKNTLVNTSGPRPARSKPSSKEETKEEEIPIIVNSKEISSESEEEKRKRILAAIESRLGK